MIGCHKIFDKTPVLLYNGCAKQPNRGGVFHTLNWGNSPPMSGHSVPVGCLAVNGRLIGGVAMIKKRIALICQYCGITFEVPISRSEQKYCSRKCSAAASRRQIKRKCKHCGKSFSVLATEVKRGGGQYCSTNCSYAASRTGDYQNCPICGKQIYVRKENGKTCCSKSCAAEYNRSYIINYDFFDSWSPELAYLWGLWAADGFIMKTGFFICLKEREHLETVGRLFCEPPPVKRGNNVWKLDVRSRKLVRLLKSRFGAQERKSLVLKWPDDLPESLERHFCRGYFDGDGYISICKTGRLKAGMTTGSRDFANELHQCLLRHGIEFRFYNYKYSILASGSACTIARFYSWLYAGVQSLYLARKKEVFDKIYQTKPRDINHDNISLLSAEDVLHAKQLCFQF